MANLQRIIEIVFQGVDNVGGSVVTVSKGLDEVADKAKDVTQPLADVTSAILRTEAALAVAGVAFLGFAYNESVQFESALLDLKKVLNESEGDVQSYIPRIEELSNTYGSAAVNVIDAAANFRQAGFDIESALTLTDTALKAVKISELDVDAASSLLIATLNGFGVEATEAARVLDVLNQLSNEYAASVGDLGVGLADLSPIAKTAGLTIEQTAGLLIPVIKVFGDGSQAANALKTALLRLTSDTGGVVKALDALGVAQTNANGELRTGGKILEDVAKVWPTLTAAQQGYYAAELAGINQAAKFQAALSNYKVVLEATDKALSAAGSATSEWEIRAEAAKEQIDRFKVSVENLLRTVGDQFRKELTNTVGATTDLSNAFRTLVTSGALDPLFNQLRPLFDGLTKDIKAIAAEIPNAFAALDLGPVIAGFDAVGVAVSNLFGGVNLTTADGLRNVLQDLVNIGGGFLQVTAGIVGGLTPLIQGIGELGQNFGKLNPETQQSAGNLLGIGTAANTLLGFVGPLTNGISALGLGLQAVAGASVVKTLTELGTAAAGASASVSGLAATVGKAGLVGAVGVAAYELGRWIDLNDKLVPGVDTLGTKIYEWLNPQEDINSAVKETTKALDGMIQAEERAAAATTDTADAIQQSADANADRADNIGITADELDAAIALDEEFAAAIAQEADNIAKADAALTDKSKTTRGYRTIIDEATGAVIGFEQVGANLATTANDGAKALELETEKATEFALELEKIASNQRIKNIEAIVSLNTAQIEADADVAVAAFESVGKTVEAVSSTVGDLVKGFSTANSIGQRFFFQNLIEEQMELQKEALEQQGVLVDAQADYWAARAKSLQAGGALVTINADGLEPELEAFMWRIIERVQIEANAEGAEFLIGL